jgi:hypothetical protein
MPSLYERGSLLLTCGARRPVGQRERAHGGERAGGGGRVPGGLRHSHRHEVRGLGGRAARSGLARGRSPLVRRRPTAWLTGLGSEGGGYNPSPVFVLISFA